MYFSLIKMNFFSRISETSRAQSPLNSFSTWCNMLLTVWVAPFPRSQHCPQVHPYSPFTSSLYSPPLCAQELGAIIIIKVTFFPVMFLVLPWFTIVEGISKISHGIPEFINVKKNSSLSVYTQLFSSHQNKQTLLHVLNFALTKNCDTVNMYVNHIFPRS